MAEAEGMRIVATDEAAAQTVARDRKVQTNEIPSLGGVSNAF